MIKYGPLYEKTERSQLTAYLSRDDGKSWEGGLLLDPRLQVSYPDAQQERSGAISIVYDFQRTHKRQILLARIREADILQKSLVSPDGFLRQEVARARGGWKEAGD